MVPAIHRAGLVDDGYDNRSVPRVSSACKGRARVPPYEALRPPPHV